MNEPSIGDSKKKGLAVTAITALAAMSSITKPEYIVAGIVLIAITGMGLFAWLEKKPKIDVDNNDKPDTLTPDSTK